jgi:hypothetical protein
VEVVDEAVGDGACCEKVVVTENLVVDFVAGLWGFEDGSLDDETIVEESGFFVLDVNFEDGAVESHSIDGGVGAMNVVKKLNASDFEPINIVAVMNDAHGIRLDIAYAERGLRDDRTNKRLRSDHGDVGLWSGHEEWGLFLSNS